MTWLTAIGRLRDGVTRRRAADAMNAMYAQQHPRTTARRATGSSSSR
jgi:hypothetical protein